MRRYNVWAGNPKGRAEDVSRCIAEVYDGFIFYQCRKKRGNGKNGLFCSVHAKKEHPFVPTDK